MDNIDGWVRSELQSRLQDCLDCERGLFEAAVMACEERAVIDACSFYETADALRGCLLEMHGLDLCTFRRAEAEMGAHNMWEVTGEPGSLRAVLWNFDVALAMVEVHCSDEIASGFRAEVQQARAEEWDRFHADEMLMEMGLEGPISTEA